MFWLYAGFVVLILLLLALDLGVLHRKVHVIRTKEALGWSAFWISLGLAFTGVIYLGYQAGWMGLGSTVDATGANDGASAALKYLTGFLVEKSLAVDNIFVIAMIFSFFAVPALYQHRVLFWGIAGALVMRGAMIALGASLLGSFSWIIYVFGGFLVLTGAKMLFLGDGPKDLRENFFVRAVRRLLPVTERYHGQHFFVRAGTPAAAEAATPDERPRADRVAEGARRGALLVTPLLLALIMVEVTDVVFAVDSIPAIFAITTDPFLVFTSNVFAILGLRSLYFALAGMIESFRYLKVALAFVLMTVGVKMLAHDWLEAWIGEHFNLVMLGTILAILAAGVLASLLRPRPPGAPVPVEIRRDKQF